MKYLDTNLAKYVQHLYEKKLWWDEHNLNK